jgi:hypothetical protein
MRLSLNYFEWVRLFRLGEVFHLVVRPGHEAAHSAPASAEVKTWIYTSTPPYVFMV